MAKKVAITNQKGGIGKTTTATAMASILRSRKYRTLLIDTDPQANSSDVYRADIDDTTTLSDIILDKHSKKDMEEAIQHTPFGDIVPADDLLENAHMVLGNDLNSFYVFKEALSEIEDAYDYIIIDTAPSRNIILQNCLVAVDEVIIPTTADRFGFQGLHSLMSETIKNLQKFNEKLTIAGLLLVKYKKQTNLGQSAQEALQMIADQHQTRLFNTKIRESIKTQEAQTARMPLLNYAASCTTERDYEAFVDEWMGVK